MSVTLLNCTCEDGLGFFCFCFSVDVIKCATVFPYKQLSDMSVHPSPCWWKSDRNSKTIFLLVLTSKVYCENMIVYYKLCTWHTLCSCDIYFPSYSNSVNWIRTLRFVLETMLSTGLSPCWHSCVNRTDVEDKHDVGRDSTRSRQTQRWNLISMIRSVILKLLETWSHRV